MSEDAKRNITGALVVKPNSDDRIPTVAVSQSGKRVIIKNADMKEDMQKEAVDIAIAAFEKNSIEKDVAERIKKEFDKKHGPTWHCIVGSNFVPYVQLPDLYKNPYCRHRLPFAAPGSYVTHETNHFIYFYLDQKAVLLFKSG